MFVGAFIICDIGTAICFVLSYLIWKKEKLTLVIGYNEDTFTGDKSQLAKVVGLLLSGIGILIFLLPFSLEYIGSLTGPLYATIIVAGTLMLLKDVQAQK